MIMADMHTSHNPPVYKHFLMSDPTHEENIQSLRPESITFHNRKIQAIWISEL